jgi:hypothetical protein
VGGGPGGGEPCGREQRLVMGDGDGSGSVRE